MRHCFYRVPTSMYAALVCLGSGGKHVFFFKVTKQAHPMAMFEIWKTYGVDRHLPDLLCELRNNAF